MILGVQINGKLRGTITVATGAGEAEAIALAKEQPSIVSHLTDLEIKQVIYVPGKILSFIAV